MDPTQEEGGAAAHMTECGDCGRCTLDHDKLVPPSGCAVRPDIAFVGEAPGSEELERGEPFVGRAGRLLREVISGLGADTSRVYYTNACLCRPPGNRTPKIGDVHACHTRLMEELEAARPRVIVALGNTALASLLGGATGITKRRGIYAEIDVCDARIGVVPTLHPAGILRAPDGFRDLVNDVALAYRISAGEIEPVVEPPYDDFVMVRDRPSLGALIRRLGKGDEVSIDLETEGLNPAEGSILSMAFAWGENPEPDEVMVLDWVWCSKRGRSLAAVAAMAGCAGVFHNCQFDLGWLWGNGIPVNLVFDTMLAHYCVDERRGSHGLKKLATAAFAAPEYDAELRRTDEDGRKLPLELTVEQWLEDPDFRDRVMRYNGADAYYTHKLKFLLRDAMEEDGVTAVHDRILLPAARHFVRFERDGMLVDADYLEEIGGKWMAEILELEGRLKAFPGAEGLNLRSSKQVADFIYGTLGLRAMAHDSEGIVANDTILAETSAVDDEEAQEYWRTQNVKRGTKARSTGTYMLWWLAQQHEFPRMLVRHRLLTKQYGAYHDGYVRLMDASGRIRPRYRLHGTRTGRLSSTDPNIHGMPRRKEIKRIFVADPGYRIISADYGQAEVRMVAHLAGDKSLIRALGEKDIHRAISKKLFHLTDAEVDAMPSEEREIKRRAAKTITFGMIYGRGPPSIAPQLGVTVREAEGYVREFFAEMPGVRTWIARQHALVMREREVTTIFGRKRRFPLIIDRRHASEIMRQAVNFPVQSAVSDMTLLAYMDVVGELDRRGVGVLLWPHVHDGFYFQVPTGDVQEAVVATIRLMHAVPFDTEVPFTVEIQTGPNWGDLEKVYDG